MNFALEEIKMILEDFVNQYWDYYLALEEEFIHTRNYLTVDKDNFKAFSTEYSKLLQTVCSEIVLLENK